MTLHKSSKRGKCFIKLALFPFLAPLLKAWGVDLPDDVVMCNIECSLYRRGMRYWEDTNKNEPFEECAINILTDSSENQVQRTFAVQQETGQAKNIFAQFALMAAGKVAPGEVARVAIKMMGVGEKKSQEKIEDQGESNAGLIDG